MRLLSRVCSAWTCHRAARFRQASELIQCTCCRTGDFQHTESVCTSACKHANMSSTHISHCMQIITCYVIMNTSVAVSCLMSMHTYRDTDRQTGTLADPLMAVYTATSHDYHEDTPAQHMHVTLPRAHMLHSAKQQPRVLFVVMGRVRVLVWCAGVCQSCAV